MQPNATEMNATHPDYQYTLSLDDNEISDAVKQSLRDAVQGSGRSQALQL